MRESKEYSTGRSRKWEKDKKNKESAQARKRGRILLKKQKERGRKWERKIVYLKKRERIFHSEKQREWERMYERERHRSQRIYPRMKERENISQWETENKMKSEREREIKIYLERERDSIQLANIVCHQDKSATSNGLLDSKQTEMVALPVFYFGTLSSCNNNVH